MVDLFMRYTVSYLTKNINYLSYVPIIASSTNAGFNLVFLITAMQGFTCTLFIYIKSNMLIELLRTANRLIQLDTKTGYAIAPYILVMKIIYIVLNLMLLVAIIILSNGNTECQNATASCGLITKIVSLLWIFDS